MADSGLVQCRSCGAMLKTTSARAGIRVTCPRCKRHVQVPTSPTEARQAPRIPESATELSDPASFNNRVVLGAVGVCVGAALLLALRGGPILAGRLYRTLDGGDCAWGLRRGVFSQTGPIRGRSGLPVLCTLMLGMSQRRD